MSENHPFLKLNVMSSDCLIWPTNGPQQKYIMCTITYDKVGKLGNGKYLAFCCKNNFSINQLLLYYVAEMIQNAF